MMSMNNRIIIFFKILYGVFLDIISNIIYWLQAIDKAMMIFVSMILCGKDCVFYVTLCISMT